MATARTEFDKFRTVGIGYGITGLVIFVLNGLIVGAIGRYKKLRARKEYIIIGALAAADAGNGLAFVLAAIYRYTWYWLGVVSQEVSPWHCFTVYNVLWYVFDPLAAFMLMVVSIDRLYAVTAPLSYFKRNRAYAIKFCSVFYAIQILQIPFLAAISYSQTELVPGICWSDNGVNERWFDTYFYSASGWSGIASIAIYAVVIIIQIMRTKNKIMDKSSRSKQREEEMKRQQRLIVTLGLSSFFTLVFLVLPSAADVIFIYWAPNEIVYKAYVAVLQNINPMLNFFLYVTRHKEMRAAVRALITFRSTLDSNIVSVAGSITVRSKTVGACAKC